MADQVIPLLLAASAERAPEAPFFACGDDRLTFGDAHRVANRVAAGFAAAGVAVGDRVALMLPNRIEMAECILGLATLGAIQVPINVFLKGEFLRYQLHDSSVSTLVTDGAGVEALNALGGLADLKRVVVVGDFGDIGAVERISYESITLGGNESFTPRSPNPADLAAILYTSGTTGHPKGCMATHAYYTHVGRSWADVLGVGSTDVLITALPLYHMGGQGHCLMMALTSGSSTIFEPAFSASTFIGRAGELGATLAMGAGAMAMAMMAMPPAETDRAHALRLAVFGPLAPAMQLGFEERFGAAMLSELFAQSECTPIAFNRPAGDRTRGTAGRPAPWHDVRLVDDGDREVPVGEVGEVVVRPKQPFAMFSGYWGRPEETLEAFRNLWHHTGDLGRFDEDGNLSYVDRKKDSLRRRGENISSIDLEAAIGQFEAIREVAVHAVPSPLGEDDVKACLVLHDGVCIEPEELFEFFSGSLPYYAIPRYVELLPELPKSVFGRVQKQVLRERRLTDSTWDFEALGLTLAPSNRR